jgi:hypothetical protein
MQNILTIHENKNTRNEYSTRLRGPRNDLYSTASSWLEVVSNRRGEVWGGGEAA